MIKTKSELKAWIEAEKYCLGGGKRQFFVFLSIE